MLFGWLWGARLIIPKNSFAANKYATLMQGPVEPQWKNSFGQATAKARVFIDVGAASDGYYTLRACKINPEIKAVALEPLRNEYRYLLQNVSINSCIGKAIPLNAAACENAGSIKIDEEDVACVSIDDLTSQLKLQRVDVIKIDVEGAGAGVIKGGLNAIRNFKPTIFFEVHNDDERSHATSDLQTARTRTILHLGSPRSYTQHQQVSKRLNKE
jgi:FkbM family methyltransferase